MVKLMIDAGHGGKDSGATGHGLYEKNVTLDLAKRIENKLKRYKNVEVSLTRNSDEYLSLTDRTNKANRWGADCFLSLHLNAASSNAAKGFETFVYNGRIDSKTVAFQNVIHQEVYRQMGNNIVDRGKKRADFHVLRETSMIALLGENLFVSNSSDSALLKQDSFLDSVAEGYTIGLEKFYGLERVIRPPTEPPSAPITGETPTQRELYQVIAGTFSSYDNATKQVEKLKQDGYNAYILKK